MSNDFQLGENEIIVSANPVKYSHIEYDEEYVTITQGRKRRRVYNGFYFDDNGVYIYVSSFISSMFQHRKKARKYVVNTKSKAWRRFDEYIITRHSPEEIKPKKDNIIESLMA